MNGCSYDFVLLSHSYRNRTAKSAVGTHFVVPETLGSCCCGCEVPHLGAAHSKNAVVCHWQWPTRSPTDERIN